MIHITISQQLPYLGPLQYLPVTFHGFNDHTLVTFPSDINWIRHCLSLAFPLNSSTGLEWWLELYSNIHQFQSYRRMNFCYSNHDSQNLLLPWGKCAAVGMTFQNHSYLMKDGSGCLKVNNKKNLVLIAEVIPICHQLQNPDTISTNFNIILIL